MSDHLWTEPTEITCTDPRFRLRITPAENYWRPEVLGRDYKVEVVDENDWARFGLTVFVNAPAPGMTAEVRWGGVGMADPVTAGAMAEAIAEAARLGKLLTEQAA